MAESHEPGTILEVNAGLHDRKDAIVTWTCSGGCDCECDCEAGHVLYELDENGNQGAEVPCQCTPDCGCEDECGGECGSLTWIVPELKAGQTKRYVIGEGEPTQVAGVTVGLRPGEQADFVVAGTPFTSYVVKEGIARPYCYPVYGPGGAEVTNLGPSDHVHHKSMYIAQGDVNGCDNWSELEGHASTINREVHVTAEGPVFGEIVSISDWVSAKGQNILQEITAIRVYNTPDNRRIMDWDITWFAAYGGVFFGDTKEAGTIAVRVAESMEVRNGGTFRNSYGGINDDECWGKRAEWVDYYGPVTSGVAGITLMDHPENLRFPTYWHVRGYGLFTANQWGIHDFTGDWSQRGDFALEGGDALNFMFRVYIHDGDTDHAGVAGKYMDFIYPPKVTVVQG